MSTYADGLLSKGERVVHREKQHWWVFVWGAKYTILAVILAVVLFFLGGSLSPDGAAGVFRMILGWVTAALFIGGLALLIWTTLRYISQEYVVTNRRVIQVEGVVNKRAVDSSLEKINDAVLTQSLFGRAFGFGDLKVLTASEAAISEFRMIRRPIEFKKAMLDAKHEYEMETSGGNQGDEPPFRAITGAPTSPAPAPVAAAMAPAAAAASAPASGTAPAAAATGGAPASDDTIATRTAGSPTNAALSPDELTRTLASLADLRDRGAISPEEYERKKADLLGRL